MAPDDLHPLDLDQPAGIVDHDDADYGAGHHNDRGHDDDVHDTVIVNDGRVVVHVNAAPGIIDHIATVVLHDQHGARVEFVKRSAVVSLDRAWNDYDRIQHTTSVDARGAIHRRRNAVVDARTVLGID